MGSEYFINSQNLENKVRDLLPSQGGAGSGFDLSASTQIIPIIDLTESAEGSNLRQDLQTAMSLSSITSFSITNATNTDIITNTGYYRVYGTSNMYTNKTSNLNLFDGVTTKNIVNFGFAQSVALVQTTLFDFIVFLKAGDSLRGTATTTASIISGNTRQIADIEGNLVNPT